MRETRGYVVMTPSIRPIVKPPSSWEMWAQGIVVMRGEVTEPDVADALGTWVPIVWEDREIIEVAFPPERWEEFITVVPGGVVRAWRLRKQ